MKIGEETLYLPIKANSSINSQQLPIQQSSRMSDYQGGLLLSASYISYVSLSARTMLLEVRQSFSTAASIPLEHRKHHLELSIPHRESSSFPSLRMSADYSGF